MLARAGRGVWIPGGATAIVLFAIALNRGTFDVVARQELAILVWIVVGVGWAAGLLPRATAPRALLVGIFGAALLCVVCAASLGWSESAGRTIEDLTRDLLYLGVLALVASIVDRDTARWTVLGAIAAGGLTLAIAMGSRLSPGLFPADSVGRIFETPRLSYPLNYWNALGAYAAMTIALGLAWSAHAESRWMRFATLAPVPLGAGIIFLTYSRAAIVGLVVAVAVVVAFARHRITLAAHAVAAACTAAAFVLVLREHRAIADATGTAGAPTVLIVLVVASALAGLAGVICARLDVLRVHRRVGRPLLAGSLAALVVVGAVFGSGTASRAWTEFSRSSTTDTTDPVARLGTLSGERYEIFASDLRAFRAHPWSGTGSGTFEFWFNRTGGVPQLRDGHSLLLEPMAELGVLGLAATLVFLGGMAAAVLLARRRARTAADVAAALGGIALLAVWIAQASVDWLWECTAVTIFALVGAASAAMVASERRRGPPGLIWRISLGLLAGAAVLIQLPGISSTRHLDASRQAGDAADLVRARREAQLAVGALPWSTAAWAQLAATENASGRPRRALADLGRAQRLEPTNWRWPYLRARAFAELGRADDAIAALRRARQLRPASPFLQRQE